MYRGEPNLKKILNLDKLTMGELKERFRDLMEELEFARNAFEFDEASEIKTEMVYIIEEIKSRSKEREQGECEC